MKTNVIFHGDNKKVLGDMDTASIDLVYFYPPLREKVDGEKLNFVKNILKDKGIFLYRFQGDKSKEEAIFKILEDIFKSSLIEIFSYEREEFDYKKGKSEQKKDLIFAIQKNHKRSNDEYLKKENYHQKHGFELRIQEIVSENTNKNSVVLDAYCNDGNFLKYVKSVGRKFIGIDQSYTACRDTAKKLNLPISSIIVDQDFSPREEMLLAENVGSATAAPSMFKSSKKKIIKKDLIFAKSDFALIPKEKNEELVKLISYFKKSANIKKEAWYLFEIRNENKEIVILSDKSLNDITDNLSFFVSLSDLPDSISKKLEKIVRIKTCLQKHNANGFLIKIDKNLKIENVYLPPNEADTHYLSNKLIDSLKSWKKEDKKEQNWLQEFYKNLSSGFLKSAGAALFALIVGLAGYLIGNNEAETENVSMKADIVNSPVISRLSSSDDCVFKYGISLSKNAVKIRDIDLSKKNIIFDVLIPENDNKIPEDISLNNIQPIQITVTPKEKDLFKVVFDRAKIKENNLLLQIDQARKIEIVVECN